MGMYDVVYLPCPVCGDRYYEQTKGGNNELLEYEFEDATPAMLFDIFEFNEHTRQPDYQCSCGTRFRLRVKFYTEVVDGS